MRFYSTYLFPRLMDWIMRSDRFYEDRRTTLAPAHGHVLEIGFGTGLNLPHYPIGITSLTGLDPARMLPNKVKQRIAAVSFPVEIAYADAERLPFPDARFDCVVSTWTLCSIPDVSAALREARRVLKPGGLFLFLEHGRGLDPRTAKWQDRLNPIQRVVGCGCNLNRPIDRLIEQAGLHVAKLDRFRGDGSPRIVGELYLGSATTNAK